MQHGFDMLGDMTKTRPSEMSSLERIRWQENLRLDLMSQLRASVDPKCCACDSKHGAQMPALEDGRSFCCAVSDILEGNEQAVCWSEMQQIADWAGVRMEHLREAHEGYIEWAIISLPYERSALPRAFRPFPEDPEMVETPMERNKLMRQQIALSKQFL